MSYTFYTINTVIDIGDGEQPVIKSGNVTTSMNLNRMVESIMIHGYPMMVSVQETIVDLEKDNNSYFYGLPKIWGECKIWTFKFSLNDYKETIKMDGIPLVIPVNVNGMRINKFDSVSKIKNTSISFKTF